MKTVWQINPNEDDPKPFKDTFLHRGCIKYNPKKLLKQLFKEVDKRKK